MEKTYSDYVLAMAERDQIALSLALLAWLVLLTAWLVSRRWPRVARWLPVGAFYAALVLVYFAAGSGG